MSKPGSGEEVLEQLDIEIAIVGEREITAHCPFHSDAHPSFSMNASTFLWICYQCGQSGTLEMLVSLVTGGKVNATEMLREVRRQAVEPKKVKTEPIEEIKIDPDVLQVRYEDFKSPPAWALDSRAITDEAIKEYGIKWDHGWIIPIWEPETADLWGWQFKRLDFVSNYPRSVKKSRTLFGLRELSSSVVALVESPLDVVRLAGAGIAAVAAYGAFVSKVQLRFLIEVADRILLALDNDEEGVRQTEKIYPYLAKRVPTIRVQMPEGCKDPGDLQDEQIEEVFGDISRRAFLLPEGSGRYDDRSTLITPRPRSRDGEDRGVHSRHRRANRHGGS